MKLLSNIEQLNHHSINCILLCKTTQRCFRFLLPLFEALQLQAWRTHAWCRAVRSKLIQWSLKRIQPPWIARHFCWMILGWRCLPNFFWVVKETLVISYYGWMCFCLQLGSFKWNISIIQTSIFWSIQICQNCLPKLPTMDPPIRSKAYLDRSKRSAPDVNWLSIRKYLYNDMNHWYSIKQYMYQSVLIHFDTSEN